MIAWTFLSGERRETFRAAVEQDAAALARARGWALWKALLCLAEADPDDPTAADHHRVVGEVLTDHARSTAASV